jgi:hypothetical protein
MVHTYWRGIPPDWWWAVGPKILSDQMATQVLEIIDGGCAKPIFVRLVYCLTVALNLFSPTTSVITVLSLLYFRIVNTLPLHVLRATEHDKLFFYTADTYSIPSDSLPRSAKTDITKISTISNDSILTGHWFPRISEISKGIVLVFKRPVQ